MSAEGEMTGERLSVDELGRDAPAVVKRVRTTKKPLLILDKGESAIVLVDAGEYGRQERRMALLERIAKGKEDGARGRVQSQVTAEELIDCLFRSEK